MVVKLRYWALLEWVKRLLTQPELHLKYGKVGIIPKALSAELWALASIAAKLRNKVTIISNNRILIIRILAGITRILVVIIRILAGIQNPGGNNQNPGGNNQNPGGNNQNPGGNNQNPGGDNQNPNGNGQPQPKEPERTDANYNQDMARHNSSANAMGHENYERLLQQRSNDFENRNAAYARQIATSVAEEQRIKLEVTAQQQRLLNAKTATEQVRRDMVAAKGTPQEATAQQNYNTAMANLQAEQARFDALLKRQQDAEQKLIRQRAEQASVAQGAAKAKYDLRFYQKFVKPKA